ncbi:MAG: response regulator [Deltaproteobacteria bacterium]|nr:response regulator [Deltaproteobacteria bacterium]
MEKLLIVDDSSTMRKIIARSLRQAGFDIGEIVEAENGQAALEKLGEMTVGMILTDINMPVMDGLTFIENIRSNPSWDKTPIVVITTEGAESMTKEAIKKGANNLVKKPFTPEQIKEKLSPYFA